MQVTVMLLFKKSQTESSQSFPFQKCLFYKYKIVKYSNSSQELFECSIFCLSNALQFSDTTLNNHFLIINISQSSIKKHSFFCLKINGPSHQFHILIEENVKFKQIISVFSLPGTPGFVHLSFEVVHGKFISVLDLKLHRQVLDQLLHQGLVR